MESNKEQQNLSKTNLLLCGITATIIIFTASMVWKQYKKIKQCVYYIVLLALIGDFTRTVGNMFLDYPYHQSLIECQLQASLKTIGGILSFQYVLLCNIIVIDSLCGPTLFPKVLTDRKKVMLIMVIMLVVSILVWIIQFPKWCSINHHSKRAHFFYAFFVIFCIIFVISMAIIAILGLYKFCKSKINNEKWKEFFHKIERMKITYKKWIIYSLFYSSVFVVCWGVAAFRRLELLNGLWPQDPQWFIYLHWILMIIYPIFNCIGLYFTLKTNDNTSFVAIYSN